MDKFFVLHKCILSYYAQSTVFIIQLCFAYELKCLKCFTSSTLHQNVIVGPRRRLIPCVTMAEHVCSSFTIEVDNGWLVVQ